MPSGEMDTRKARHGFSNFAAGIESKPMPRRPRGEKRRADVIGMSVNIMRIATGEESEELETDRPRVRLPNSGAEAAKLGRHG